MMERKKKQNRHKEALSGEDRKIKIIKKEVIEVQLNA